MFVSSKLITLSPNKKILLLFFFVTYVALLIMALVLVLVIVTYPMLACVDSPIPVVGYIVGFSYTFF